MMALDVIFAIFALIDGIAFAVIANDHFPYSIYNGPVFAVCSVFSFLSLVLFVIDIYLWSRSSIQLWITNLNLSFWFRFQKIIILVILLWNFWKSFKHGIFLRSFPGRGTWKKCQSRRKTRVYRKRLTQYCYNKVYIAIFTTWSGVSAA